MTHDLIGKKVVIRGIANHQGIEVRVGIVARITGDSVPIGALAIASIFGISANDGRHIEVTVPLYQAEPDKYISPAAWVKGTTASLTQPTADKTEVGRAIIERSRQR
jgi:hypothetical protein